jgi:hypothetical protein
MEEVRLTVRDDSGARCAIGTDSARVLVNSAPSVDAGPAFVTKIGGAHDVVRFDASGASDPDGHGLRLTWDFGDGTTATGAVVRHRYTSRGEFLVTVTAEDETGLSCGVASDMTAVAAVPRE